MNLGHFRIGAVEVFYQHGGFNRLLQQLQRPDLPWLGAKRLRILLQAASDVRLVLLIHICIYYVNNLR